MTDTDDPVERIHRAQDQIIAAARGRSNGLVEAYKTALAVERGVTALQGELLFGLRAANAQLEQTAEELRRLLRQAGVAFPDQPSASLH